MEKFYFHTGRSVRPPLYFAKTIALLFLTVLSLGIQAQDLRKIDPVLGYVLTHPKDETARKSLAGLYQVEPTEGFASRGGPVEKRYNCIVYTANGRALRDSGMVINSVLPTFATAWVTLDQLTRLSYMKDVKYISASDNDFLHNDVARGNSGADLLHSGALNGTPYKGKGVIVAVYDSGIDWDHPDFRDPVDQTKSRILRIWDQTITATGAEVPPAGFSYGVEYTQAHLNDELDGTPTGFVRENDINGHGTHVAGTATGNGSALASKKYMGMAPEADIVIIKGGNGSFPITNSVDAITYLQALSATLGKPVVLNMSIGSIAGAHDGTRPHELAANTFTASGPGRVIVISAGNDNGSLAHRQLTLPGSGTGQIDFTVPSATTGSDIFRFRMYVSDADPISAVLTVPGGETVSVSANQDITGDVLTGGFRVFLYNQVDPANGHRYLEVYILRLLTGTNPVGPWSLAITNGSASPKITHGWMNYKNTTFAAAAIVGGDNNYMVGSPGTSSSAITVASYIGKLGWFSNNSSSPGGVNYTNVQQDNISTFSSWGPRRDNVQKPDIAAQGQAMISCLSSNDPLASSSTDIVEVGLYRKNQGTSMAAPVVTGCVALLLQTKPTATAAEIKTALTSTANKDASTEASGATPNYVWGGGRIDVLKAAASLFPCGPTTRKTFLYENPYISTQDANATLTTQRIAVRFTPDISGQLGGVFFHTVSNAGAGGTFNLTSLTLEVRQNNSNTPGALIASKVILPSFVSKFSWNYFDLSTLAVPVTSGTDYFIVLVPGAGSTWGVRSDNVAVDNRSLFSFDGSSWSSPTGDYRIRSVVYSTAQNNAAIASLTSVKAQEINSSQQFFNSSCELIAKVQPAGATPVSGAVSSKVTVHGGPQTAGPILYVGRHYDIEPAANAATATARVTLYFTQAEFTAFNNAAGSVLDLPTGPGDAAGIANLKVSQYHGTSPTGIPGSYSGTGQIIDPADNDIVWNAERSRWEVTIDVNGFSGFFIQTSAILPVTVEYFTGNKQGNTHLLKWKVSCTAINAVRFDVERSADGVAFSKLGSVSGTQLDCLQEFSYTDQSPLAGNNYYRIKVTEDNGHNYYTNVILLKTDGALQTAIWPNLLRGKENITISFGSSRGVLVIHDAAGKRIYSRNLSQGVLSIPSPVPTSGMYFYTITDEKGHVSKGKIVVK